MDVSEYEEDLQRIVESSGGLEERAEIEIECVFRSDWPEAVAAEANGTPTGELEPPYAREYVRVIDRLGGELRARALINFDDEGQPHRAIDRPAPEDLTWVTNPRGAGNPREIEACGPPRPVASVYLYCFNRRSPGSKSPRVPTAATVAECVSPR